MGSKKYMWNILITARWRIFFIYISRFYFILIFYAYHDYIFEWLHNTPMKLWHLPPPSIILLNDNIIIHIRSMVGEGRCVSSEATASSALGSHRSRRKIHPTRSARRMDVPSSDAHPVPLRQPLLGNEWVYIPSYIFYILMLFKYAIKNTIYTYYSFCNFDVQSSVILFIISSYPHMGSNGAQA